ncbi:unnamed protein product [Brassica rapa]|uniref:DUF547 domain-containing protein n=2 Tax=Brassica TaxID=3705 RepID=A0A3P6CVK8_BRACM|nr:unnamed protein product [Brassica napus]CAG7906530.1 unnamed protein product [Brassica rapa]CDY44592.1 BnaA04g09980D [Brassica napus]VDD12442.1 unnamed protein product [Brassica rapa]
MICGAQASGKTPLFDDQFEFSRPYSSMIEVSHIHRNHRKGHDLDLMNRNFRTGDEHQEYSLDHSKPLLYFALCSGNHSDPAIRVYTPKWIYQELETAKEEYVHATFGVKKDQKLVLPKIIESFSKDSGLSLATLMEMIQECLPEIMKKRIKKLNSWRSRRALLSGCHIAHRTCYMNLCFFVMLLVKCIGGCMCKCRE